MRRSFYRYGIDLVDFEKQLYLIKAEEEPAVICITCIMSYWYYGAQKTIEIVRKYFPDTPIIFGGIYATLWQEHSKKNIDADYFVFGAGENEVLDICNNITKFNRLYTDDKKLSFKCLSPQVFDLYSNLYSAAIMTSRGCPFNCVYCASKKLFDNFLQFDIEGCVELIKYLVFARKVEDICFYDDALLANTEKHFLPICEKLLSENIKIRFHLPNAVHIKFISRQVAQMFKKLNFSTIRLGFESADKNWNLSTSAKYNFSDLDNCIENLKAVNIDLSIVKAYILTGAPGQDLKDIWDSVDFIKKKGISADFAFFSPIPETPIWFECIKKFPEIIEEPLLTNSSVFPVLTGHFFDRRNK